MHRSLPLIIIAWSVLAAQAAGQNPVSSPRELKGCCDASAAVALDAHQFIVASNEDSVLRIYDRETGAEPLRTVDLSRFLQIDPQEPEADIEAAARMKDTIYWITSHSRTKSGKHRESRYRLWATKVTGAGKQIAVTPLGQPASGLFDALLTDRRLTKYELRAAAEKGAKEPGAMNIEGLSATPEGQLLIGFRSPLPDDKTLVVPLENPAQVVAGQPPRLGAPMELDLSRRGIRGMEYWPERGRHVIVAGGGKDGAPFTVFLWSGKADERAEELPGVDFGELHPESVVVYPGESERFQVVCDDGSRVLAGRECKESDASQQHFRSVWVNVPAR